MDTVGQTGQQLADTFVPIGMADGNGGVFHNKSYYDAAKTGADMVEEAKALLEGAGYTFTENGDGSYAISPALGFEYLTNTSTVNPGRPLNPWYRGYNKAGGLECIPCRP